MFIAKEEVRGRMIQVLSGRCLIPAVDEGMRATKAGQRQKAIPRRYREGAGHSQER